MDNSIFKYEVQKQFFDYLVANNRNEIIRYFREIEYKPWEFIDEEGNTGIIINNFSDLKNYVYGFNYTHDYYD